MSRRNRGNDDEENAPRRKRKDEESDGDVELGGRRKRRGSKENVEVEDNTRRRNNENEDIAPSTRRNRRRDKESDSDVDKMETPKKNKRGDDDEETPSQKKRGGVTFDSQSKEPNIESPEKKLSDDTALLNEGDRKPRKKFVSDDRMGCCEVITYMLKLEDGIISIQACILINISDNFGSQCADGSYTLPCPSKGCSVALPLFMTVEGAIGIVFLFFSVSFTLFLHVEPRETTTSTSNEQVPYPKPSCTAWTFAFFLYLILLFKAVWLVWGVTLIFNTTAASCINGGGVLYAFAVLYVVICFILTILYTFSSMASNSVPSQLKHKTKKDIEKGGGIKTGEDLDFENVKPNVLLLWKNMIKVTTIMSSVYLITALIGGCLYMDICFTSTNPAIRNDLSNCLVPFILVFGLIIVPLSQLAADTENRRLLLQQSILNWVFSISLFIMGCYVFYLGMPSKASSQIDISWLTLTNAQQKSYLNGKSDLLKQYEINNYVIGAVVIVFSIILAITGIGTSCLNIKIARLEWEQGNPK